MATLIYVIWVAQSVGVRAFISSVSALLLTLYYSTLLILLVGPDGPAKYFIWHLLGKLGHQAQCSAIRACMVAVPAGLVQICYSTLKVLFVRSYDLTNTIIRV